MIDAKSYTASLFDLTGHVGIVTGASRGLGMGQAKVLTDAGATVYNDASGKVRYLTHYPTLARLDPGENTVRLELYDVLHQPNIQKFEIVPRWWTA